MDSLISFLSSISCSKLSKNPESRNMEYSRPTASRGTSYLWANFFILATLASFYLEGQSAES